MKCGPWGYVWKLWTTFNNYGDRKFHVENNSQQVKYISQSSVKSFHILLRILYCSARVIKYITSKYHCCFFLVSPCIPSTQAPLIVYGYSHIPYSCIHPHFDLKSKKLEDVWICTTLYNCTMCNTKIRLGMKIILDQTFFFKNWKVWKIQNSNRKCVAFFFTIKNYFLL